MTNLLSEAAAAMAKAAHDRRTPEARTEKASKAASARWKGHGLTRDQERVLRKLVRSDAGAISKRNGTAGGLRIAGAVITLSNLGLVHVLDWRGDHIAYRRGPKWRPDLLD